MSCFKPKLIRDKNGILQSVACGHCPPCCYNKLAGWTFRLMQEERHSLSSHFITLTYDRNNLVLTPYGRPSLTVYHLQCFFKRLRKAHRRHCYYNEPLKYYAVGEYGSKTKRPHYHIILFNADIELIEKAWEFGHVYYGDVSHASVGYTLKYLNKPRNAGLIGDDDRHPEFTTQSNYLGIKYLSEQMKSYYLADMHNRRHITLPNGCKAALPRYYYEKLFDGYQRDLLKMSGSLIRQDEFFKEFSKGYEQRVTDISLFNIRVEAAIRRHDNNQQQKLCKL